MRTKLGWAYALFRRQIDDFLPALLSVAFIPLIVIGLFTSPWTRTEATRHLYLGAFVLATLVGYSFAVTNIRYLLAIIPLLLIWTAYGSTVFAAWLSATVTKISSGSINLPSSLSKAVVIVGLIVLSTPSILAKFDQQDITGIPLEEKRAGLWLRSHGADGSTTVMASHATVAYYAGANHLFLPDEDLGTIIDYAKRRRIDFIVVSSRRSGHHKRSFTEVSPESAQDLELVHSDLEGGEEYSIRIYKVRL